MATVVVIMVPSYIALPSSAMDYNVTVTFFPSPFSLHPHSKKHRETTGMKEETEKSEGCGGRELLHETEKQLHDIMYEDFMFFLACVGASYGNSTSTFADALSPFPTSLHSY